jgi:hypothetical protein
VLSLKQSFGPHRAVVMKGWQVERQTHEWQIVGLQHDDQVVLRGAEVRAFDLRAARSCASLKRQLLPSRG